MNYSLINPINPNYSPIEQVLYNRGIQPEDIDHYLNTNSADIIPSDLLNNILQGGKMLIQHIHNNDLTYVQVDADCDGYTSAAVLINWLHRLFPHFTENYVTWGLHKQKEHGIDIDNLPKDVKFVIVPDASSNEFEIHEYLQKQGIDVLILDHHEAPMISPYACVINNQLDNYPNKTLSGVGVVYKFCNYLDDLLGVKIVDDLLDLVAVGLVGDMMDVRAFETKELISQGLAQIHNPFIKGMIDKDQFHFSTITQHNIAFYLVPLINAVTRVGELSDKQILFEAMLEHRADILIPSTKRGEKGKLETIATQAVRMCGNVKRAQTSAQDTYYEIAENLIEENNLTNHRILVVCLPPDKAANKNLTGLIANKIANTYYHPTLILNYTVEDAWVGSGRNYTNSSLQNFKDLVANTGLVNFAEGHQSAFGVSIPADNLEAFIELTDKQLENMEFLPVYHVDFIYGPNDPIATKVLDIASYQEYWGQGISEPLIAIEHIKVTKDNLTLMSRDKNPTLKITLPNNISLIKFRSNEEEFNSLYSAAGYVEINVIGTCALNEWMGNISAQVLIEDYEIIMTKQYYF